MKIKLSAEMDALLQDIARKAHLDVGAFRNVRGDWELNTVDRKTLMDVVSNEFAASGLESNDEPNKRGLVLEEILDRLNTSSIP